MLSNRLWLKRVHQDQDWYLVDTTSKDVIEVATRRREDVEIPTLRSTIRPSQKSTNVVQVSTEAVALTRSRSENVDESTTGSSSD
jgi:hypothetical protein